MPSPKVLLQLPSAAARLSFRPLFRLYGIDRYRQMYYGCETCIKVGSYIRSIIYRRKRKVIIREVIIFRVRFSDDSGTFAVLGEAFIPHSSYSYSFVMKVLMEYLHHRGTISEICSRAGISPTTLYRWKKRYLLDALRWIALQAMQACMTDRSADRTSGKQRRSKRGTVAEIWNTFIITSKTSSYLFFLLTHKVLIDATSSAAL